MIAGVVLAYILSQFFVIAKHTLKYCKNFRANLMVTLFNFAIWLPCGKYYLQKERNKAINEFRERQKSKRTGQQYKLPEEPWTKEAIMRRMTTGRDAAK